MTGPLAFGTAAIALLTMIGCGSGGSGTLDLGDDGGRNGDPPNGYSPADNPPSTNDAATDASDASITDAPSSD